MYTTKHIFFLKTNASTRSSFHPSTRSFSAGSSHYYVLTDTTDEANAALLGLNHSPKLAFSRGGATTASLDFEKVILVDREGKVNTPSVRHPCCARFLFIAVPRCVVVTSTVMVPLQCGAF